MSEHPDKEKPKGWIGVDLDGTLAHYDRWQGVYVIGSPVWAMVAQVRLFLKAGYEVRIFTARLHGLTDEQRQQFQRRLNDWLLHLCMLPPLTATNVKDFDMVELWDDRAVTVGFNTGERLSPPSGVQRGLE